MEAKYYDNHLRYLYIYKLLEFARQIESLLPLLSIYPWLLKSYLSSIQGSLKKPHKIVTTNVVDDYP